MVLLEQRSLPSRVIRGAAAGAAVGLCFIAVGLVRAAVFLLGGGHIPGFTGRDWRMLVFYVGGFTLGGAVLGVVRPLLRGNVGVYIGCMLVGVVVMFTIAISDKGSLWALDPPDWIAFAAMGILFGAAGAFGWTRSTR